MKRFIFLLAALLVSPLDCFAQKAYTRVITASPTVDTNAYATGELVGGKLTFTGSKAGFVVSAQITDLAAQAVDFDVVLFDANPSATTFTDQAAFDIADADIPKVIGVINFPSTSRFAFADNSVHFVGGLGIPFSGSMVSGNPTIYGALISRGTPTFAASTDVKVKLAISQD